uniref:D-aminoacyl-tRNA deacylase n=1 Tax=Monascus pilosus TaxID=89488 RepID=R9UMH9_MONPI|nr:d-tyrosyl-tRNA(Tyr) deacylase [Monascus pilosus]
MKGAQRRDTVITRAMTKSPVSGYPESQVGIRHGGPETDLINRSRASRSRGSGALWYVNLDPSESPEATFSQSNPVSQFTLYGNLKKGNKPDFHDAADVETARRLYDYFYNRMRDSYRPESVKNGVFQAMMEVELKNDGPVTIELDTNVPKKEPKKEDGQGKAQEKK